MQVKSLSQSKGGGVGIKPDAHVQHAEARASGWGASSLKVTRGVLKPGTGPAAQR